MAQDVKTKTKARGLERAFKILDYLCATGLPQRPLEISIGMSAPKSSIYELVGLLTSVGVLERVDADGRVFLGRKLNFWGVNYLKHFDLTGLAQPILEWITKQTRETSQLCMLDGNKYFVSMMNEGNRPFRISADVGERIPIPWTASGRLLTGHMSEKEIIDFIPNDDFILPDGSMLDATAFAESAQLAWAEKFFSFDSVADNFTHCFAAPVIESNGLCKSTLCIIAPKDDARKNYELYKGVLIEAVSKLVSNIAIKPDGQHTLAAE